MSENQRNMCYPPPVSDSRPPSFIRSHLSATVFLPTSFVATRSEDKNKTKKKNPLIWSHWHRTDRDKPFPPTSSSVDRLPFFTPNFSEIPPPLCLSFYLCSPMPNCPEKIGPRRGERIVGSFLSMTSSFHILDIFALLILVDT